MEDPQNLDSVSHSIYYIRRQEGTVSGLTFIGSSNQFSPLDRKLLAKCIARVKDNAEKGIVSSPGLDEAPPVIFPEQDAAEKKD